MISIKSGQIKGVINTPSPNFNSRPDGESINLLVIHNISLPPGVFGETYIDDLFLNQLDYSKNPYFSSLENLQVSAHCLIRRDGELVQFVNFNDRAWHAGQSVFEDKENCNDYSIGIELEGTDDIPYTDGQYEQLVDLTVLIMSNYPGITQDRIVGHEHIAPQRKTDPGKAFDWSRYFCLIKNKM